MRDWDPQRLAVLAGAELLREGSSESEPRGPGSVVIDSRRVTPGALFVGLRGSREDGGIHAPAALEAGAWGVLTAPEQARAALASSATGAVLAHPDPLAALQALARAWRRELEATVIAITGSTGKTSTKDILAALLAPHRKTVSSPENFNTEIGLPLAVLAAPAGTEVLVLEMAMRGPGQIAELAQIAEPDVGVITNIGPVHLELLGSLQAIAAAKAELIDGLPSGGTVVIPIEPLLDPHMRPALRTITFGDGGQVRILEDGPDGEVVIGHGGEQIRLRPSFSQPHNLRNLLAAVAAARAIGVTHEGELQVRFSALRGERLTLANGITLINDCYNANPLSMRAAIDDLVRDAPARRVAVLGDMLELGRSERRFHHQIADHLAAKEVELLITVGPLAAEMLEGFPGEGHAVSDALAAAPLLRNLLQPQDTVLIKGSRGVGMERIAAILLSEADGDRLPAAGAGTTGVS
jgi:UDP-N-acetylmuramoyl-tripeptide--D-alanyl-D-alanine ligase